jgi:PilZ domain
MPSTSDPHVDARRKPRFRFNSLVRVTATHPDTEIVFWGRATDLCREGIGVTISNRVKCGELVRMDIPLPDRSFVGVTAFVRYCNRDHCGFEFVDVEDQQSRAIRAACERLQRAGEGV